MMKFAAHITAISLALVGSAAAADIAVRRPAPVAPVVPVVVGYNWTGCYVGAGFGYGMFNQESQYINGGVAEGVSNDNGGRGYFGTAQVGCDFQVGSTWVIGAFADYDFAGGIKGDMSVASLGIVGEEKIKWAWAAGGRIGWLPVNQLLVFWSAGYTQVNFDQVNFVIATSGATANLEMGKNTYSGWFLGGGYEYALGWMPGLFWKTEYRFSSLSSETVPLFQSGTPTGDSVDNRKYIHAVRSELVWRFSFGGPVVARY